MEKDNTSIKESEKKPLVLLVEDHWNILYIHKRYLEKMGFNVDTARTGKEAFKKFINYPYLFVILDGGLPDTNGCELGKRLREYENAIKKSRTPFILLSGYPSDQVKEWCQQADIDAYAIKPITLEELKQLVSQCLSQ